MDMIRAVLFDLDGTLLDRDTSVRSFLRDQYIRFQRYLGRHASIDQYVSLFLKLDDRGLGNKHEIYDQIFSEFSVEGLNPKALCDDYYESCPSYYKGFEALHETLTELKNQGLFLGIVSNGRESVQQKKIDKLGIREHFGPKMILISESVGVKKTNKAIFQEALNQLNEISSRTITPEETVFVGDNLTADIEGAKKAGMKAIWKIDDSRHLTPPEDEIIEKCADSTIVNLEDIPKVISITWKIPGPDPFLSVIGTLSGKSLSAEEIERDLYGN